MKSRKILANSHNSPGSVRRSTPADIEFVVGSSNHISECTEYSSMNNLE